ncbi:MAG: T9SS type A sorting domain-containing protein, partial [Bacteroidota bacterium]
LIQVYPNPTKAVINFSDEIQSLNIYTIEGRLLLEEQEPLRSYDLSNHPEGTYIIKVLTSSGSQHSYKIIKE